jgi:methyl-accepting chemotaxis protein
MSLDFATAKLKHMSWKLKLRDFLDGKPGLTAAQATSHKDCDLGKWMYSEGIKRYSNVPAMTELEKVHETLHKTIKTIVDLRTGGKVKEAEAEFGKVEAISKKIVELLTTVEAATKKAA